MASREDYLISHAALVEADDVVPSRYWRRIVVAPDGCWLWQGALYPSGYGHIRMDGRDYPAHRLFYEWLVGPIPEGLQIDHLCRTRACIYPAHLEPVTQAENARRARKTHCVRGHAFTPANTRILPKGGRRCRRCQYEYLKAWKAARRSS